MTGYCGWVSSRPPDDPNRAYHDLEYGFPLSDDRGLFRLLVLEINQAGLSWSTILNKRAAFDRAYDGFDLDRVAAYGSTDVERLMADSGIIRNRRKIEAAIENARRLVALRPACPSFGAWLDAHHPLPREEWVKLFKRTFVFTGGEITGEFLMSSGYLEGAHALDCPIRDRAIESGAAWAKPLTSPRSSPRG
jgi:DNA-3-methyladenine glycosylase I